MARRFTGMLRNGSRWLLALTPCAFAGCVTDSITTSYITSRPPNNPPATVRASSFATTPTLPTPKPTETTLDAKPAYGQAQAMPIDLPTVIRLADTGSPMIGFAQARVREAEAKLDQANLQWVPTLAAGIAYNRFDGNTQNQQGRLFYVSRSNLFYSGGGSLNLDIAEAVYRPLIEQRSLAAEQYRAQAVTLGSELDAVLAYWDLVQVHSQLEINRETLDRAEAMLQAAKNAQTAKLDRSAGDVHRAATEALFRRTERADLQARVSAASARLSRLLLLPPNVTLLPTETKLAPITMIAPQSTIDDLLNTALQARPDLAANREALAAAWERVRRQQYGPLLPKFTIANQTGSFGAGINSTIGDYRDRNALTAQLFWELKNFGLGNLADLAERRAVADQMQYQMLEQQARVTAEIVELAQLAAKRQEALELAETAVKEATELYRISKEGTFNVVDAKNLFDALRPLQAIQVLNTAQTNYLSALVDYNRAQFRLYVALGRPPLPESTPFVKHP